MIFQSPIPIPVLFFWRFLIINTFVINISSYRHSLNLALFAIIIILPITYLNRRQAKNSVINTVLYKVYTSVIHLAKIKWTCIQIRKNFHEWQFLLNTLRNKEQKQDMNSWHESHQLGSS